MSHLTCHISLLTSHPSHLTLHISPLMSRPFTSPMPHFTHHISPFTSHPLTSHLLHLIRINSPFTSCPSHLTPHISSKSPHPSPLVDYTPYSSFVISRHSVSTLITLLTQPSTPIPSTLNPEPSNLCTQLYCKPASVRTL